MTVSTKTYGVDGRTPRNVYGLCLSGTDTTEASYLYIRGVEGR